MNFANVKSQKHIKTTAIHKIQSILFENAFVQFYEMRRVSKKMRVSDEDKKQLQMQPICSKAGIFIAAAKMMNKSSVKAERSLVDF